MYKIASDQLMAVEIRNLTEPESDISLVYVN